MDIETLMATLRPFAEDAKRWDDKVSEMFPIAYSEPKLSGLRVGDLRRAAEAYAALDGDALETVDYVGQIAMLKERLRIAEAVTENSKRAHEILVSQPVMAVGGERRAVLEEAARLVAQKAERNEKFEGGTNSYSRSLARELREIEAAIRNLASASPSLSQEREQSMLIKAVGDSDAVAAYFAQERDAGQNAVLEGLEQLTRELNAKSVSEALPFEIEKWLITIKSHCTIIADPGPSDDLKQLALCIKINVDQDLRPVLRALSQERVKLDKVWEEINARGGFISKPNEFQEGCAHEISEALHIIEKYGGMDPLVRKAKLLEHPPYIDGGPQE